MPCSTITIEASPATDWNKYKDLQSDIIQKGRDLGKLTPKWTPPSNHSPQALENPMEKEAERGEGLHQENKAL